LDLPTSGEVYFNGINLDCMNENDIADFRNKSIGFVFQFYYLLPEFSVLENVMLPCLISGLNKKEAAKRAQAALAEVSLLHRLNHMPAQLSGGEQQRVAIARAAVIPPKLILADEPTGNLDRHTGEKIFEYLLRLNRDDKISMIIVSHNLELLAHLPKKYLLKDGKLNEM